MTRLLRPPENLVLDGVSTATQWLFSPAVSLPLAAILVVVLWVVQRPALGWSLARFFPAVIAGVVLKSALRLPAPHGLSGVSSMGGVSSCSVLQCGLPSGHMLRATFLILWLALVLVPAARRSWGLSLGVLLALFVGWTRIYAGDHFVLDVVGGLLVGLAFLPAAQLVARPGSERSHRPGAYRPERAGPAAPS
ncbi:MAG: phosphatase PAP2 family protein [Chloroflexi bacterium]|nr:phosphatase PAP2 family protein [Chloroflexota bacterium]